MSLYEGGILIQDKLRASLLSEEDVSEQIRIMANVDSLDKLKSVYMERNGKISAVKKDEIQS